MSSDFPLENLLISYRSSNETIQMKATAYYFLVVLFRFIKCNYYPRYYYSWLNTVFLAGRLGAAPTFWYREQETSTRRLLTFYTTICISLTDNQDTHQRFISLQNLILRYSIPCTATEENGTTLHAPVKLAWENSRHLATLPVVSPPNDVWETSAEIPYWWRVITQIWVVLLIGRAAWEIWFKQSDALPRSGYSFSDVIWRGNQW